MRSWVPILLILALLLLANPTTFAGTHEASSNWWLMTFIGYMLRGSAKVRPSVFYTPEFYLEPGFLVNFQKEEQPTHIDFGVTPRVFSVGVTTQLGQSDLLLSAGYASRQDRLDSMYYAAITMIAATW